MIIVLKPDATEKEIEHVMDRVRELGLSPHLSKGQERTIIGVIGDDRLLANHPLRAIPGVEEVVPILAPRSEEHTSELQSRLHLVCRLLLEKKKITNCSSMFYSTPVIPPDHNQPPCRRTPRRTTPSSGAAVTQSSSSPMRSAAIDPAHCGDT